MRSPLLTNYLKIPCCSDYVRKNFHSISSIEVGSYIFFDVILLSIKSVYIVEVLNQYQITSSDWRGLQKHNITHVEETSKCLLQMARFNSRFRSLQKQGSAEVACATGSGGWNSNSHNIVPEVIHQDSCRLFKKIRLTMSGGISNIF